MKYLRRSADGQAIYNCPDCGCELHASKELLKYLLHKHFSEKSKAMCAKLTPEQRKEKAKKAINARWERVRALSVDVTTVTPTNGTGSVSTNL